jgi:hypothetical protein
LRLVKIQLNNFDLSVKIKKKSVRTDELQFINFISSNFQVKNTIVWRNKLPCQKGDIFRCCFIAKDRFGVQFIQGDRLDLLWSEDGFIAEKDVAMGQSHFVLVDDSD